MVDTNGACHGSVKRANQENQEECEHDDEEDKGRLWALMDQRFCLELDHWFGGCFSFLSLMTERSGWFIMEQYIIKILCPSTLHFVNYF